MGKLSLLLHNIRTEKVTPYIKGDVLNLGCGPSINIPKKRVRHVNITELSLTKLPFRD